MIGMKSVNVKVSECELSTEDASIDRMDGEGNYKTGTMVHFPRNIVINRDDRLIYYCIKRALDVLFSVVGLILLSPFLLITAIAIKLDSKGKIIYSQLRTGKDGKTFKMYKFRSMLEDAELLRYDLLDKNEMDGPVFKIADDPRITKVGKFIRKTSIDELPQLINIIKGDMSIVGPRPLVTYETEQFTNYENMRHQVKPGLTCYWQISGRNDINFDQWIELDIKYLREMSLWTDVKIIFRTFSVVVLGKGAY